MWTKLMVRLWAIVNEPAYQRMAIRNILMFFASIIFICEAAFVSYGGKLSLGDIALIGIAMLIFAYYLYRVIKILIKEIKDGHIIRNRTGNGRRDYREHC